MTLDEAIILFGLPPQQENRLEIRQLLVDEIRREENEEGDQFLMRLLCAQLFALGCVEDSLLIWQAKSCNFDTMLGIDVQFLCVSGLEKAKKFFTGVGSEEATSALAYIEDCEKGGDFKRYPVDVALEAARKCYKADELRHTPGPGATS